MLAVSLTGFTGASGCTSSQDDSTPLPPEEPWPWRPLETTGPSTRGRRWSHTSSWWA